MSQNGKLYFPHDSDARHDPKIIKIEKVFGDVAYSWYFKTLEYLYNQGGKLARDAFFATVLNEQAKIPTNKVDKFIDKCIADDVGLFYIAEHKGFDYLRSKSLDKRLAIIKEKSEKRREAARRRWGLDKVEVTDDQIGRIYDAYPRKKGRVKACEHIRRDLEAGEIKFDDLLDRTKKFYDSVIHLKNTDDWRFVPHASTWFNQKRWTDEVEKPVKSGRREATKPKPGKYEKAKPL